MTQLCDSIACNNIIVLTFNFYSRYQIMFLTYIIKLGLWLIKIVLFPTKLYFMLQNKKYCPPIEDKLLKIPATILAEKIRKQELSSVELVKCYIQRIQAVNPILNAVVKDRFDEALSEAKLVDKMLLARDMTEEELRMKKPLLGIPFTVKESIPVKGMSNNAGSAVFDRNCIDYDHEIVQQMQEAGAIPLVVTNTPELCMNWETSNKVTGRTVNPYDTRRTCGGSSGGEVNKL